VTQQAVWLTIGAIAQVLFAGRMLVQWWASERAGRSVVPYAFWSLSFLAGGLMLAYACWREDPIFVVGQLSGLVVYGRNLVLWKPEPVLSSSQSASA
jgi:lipid-A-disaccharide synthase-like uncharacterized protein